MVTQHLHGQTVSKGSDSVRLPADRKNIALAIHVGLLVLAAVYWYAITNIDAPFVYHPDEQAVVRRGLRMALTGDLNPHWFHYPTLMMYVDAAVFKLVKPFLDIPLELGLRKGVQGGHPDVFAIYQAARLVTICFSLGTLYLLLRLTSRVTFPIIASLAGITFVGSELVRDSAASATVDMPMTFFVVASLVSMVKFVDSARGEHPKERFLWFAAVLGGLAAGTKYNGAAILFAVPLAMWLAEMPLRWSLRRLPLLAMLSVAVFLATTPYSILDVRTFLSPIIGMPYNFVHYSTGHLGADEGSSFLKAIGQLFTRHSVLAVLALLSPLAARKAAARKPLGLVGFSAVIFLGMVMAAKIFFPRNLMPSLPLLDCLAVAGIWGLAGTPLFRDAKKWAAARTTLLFAAAFAVAGYGSIRAVSDTLLEMKLKDNRTLAYEWIAENVPSGSLILQEAYCPQLYFLENLAAMYVWTVSQVPFEEAVGKFDYVVVSDTQWERFGDWGHGTYESLFDLPLLREWKSRPGESRGPTIRIYSVGRRAER